MASTGKKGKKNKGKTVPLNDFLSNNTMSWSDQVEEADKLGEFIRKPALPAAPRAARALEIDESRIPKNPPYVAYLSNLSYELEEADILNSFSDLVISNVRLPRDEHSGRMKGFGYVEFDDRNSLISALQKHEATIRGRRIKIDIAENEGERRRGGMRDNRERKSNYDPEKTLGDWRSGPRSELSSASTDDRKGTTFGRREYSGFRDKDSHDKSRGDRESSWRDNERWYGSDRESRGGYASRRNYEDGESNSEPKTRTKLNLKPRRLPIENVVIKDEPSNEEERREQEKSSSASIFGQAKPVDTAAREREIELRLEKEREVLKSEKDIDKTKNNEEYSSSEGREFKPAPETKENVWSRKSQKSEAQNSYQGQDNEKTSDLDDEPLPNNDSQRNISENLEESVGYDFARKNEEYDDRDTESRYNRQIKNDNRFSEKGRDVDRGYRRDEKWRDDRDRRGRRDYETRDRGYDSDRRIGNNGGKGRETDRESDSRRYNDKDNENKRFIYEKDVDWRKNTEKDSDNKRFQERDSGRHRDQDDHGNKGSRGDRRGGSLSGDKGSRQVKNNQDRGPQSKDKSRDQKKSEDGLRMPKFREASAPNYVGLNKYSFLEEDGASE